MITWVHIFPTTVIVLLVCALNIMIWRDRLSGRTRLTAATVSGVFFLLIFIGFQSMMGLPKLISTEWLVSADEVTVVSYKIHEKKTIFLWLSIPGKIEPRNYQMPYDAQIAKQLRRQSHQANRTKSKLKMKNPFERREGTLNQEKMFYPEPQKPNPTKR